MRRHQHKGPTSDRTTALLGEHKGPTSDRTTALLGERGPLGVGAGVAVITAQNRTQHRSMPCTGHLWHVQLHMAECLTHVLLLPLLVPCVCVHSKVIRCALENACSVAKTFLLADVVVTEIPEKAPAAAAAGGADDYGY